MRTENAVCLGFVAGAIIASLMWVILASNPKAQASDKPSGVRESTHIRLCGKCGAPVDWDINPRFSHCLICGDDKLRGGTFYVPRDQLAERALEKIARLEWNARKK